MTFEQQILDLASGLLLLATLWWGASATLWILALRADHRNLRRLAGAVALPGTRRLAQAVLAAGLATLPACSPQPQPPTLEYLGEVTTTPPSMAPPSTTTSSTTTSSTSSTSSTTATTATTATTEPAATTTITTEPDTPGDRPTEPTIATPEIEEPPVEAPPVDEALGRVHSHEVVPGDHLWGIAAQHLRRAGRNPTDHEIAAYWRRVITANAATIRSGDPNLIVPGEIVTLPPLT